MSFIIIILKFLIMRESYTSKHKKIFLALGTQFMWEADCPSLSSPR